MRRIALLALAIGFLAPLLASAPAHAQATRTWVSGVGDDANPCSRTAPCKTFAGAISKTAAQGEIDCLDPGGFGGITITKAITLNCSATLGSILVAGTNGITINAGASDKVVIRSIQLQGLGPSGTPGLVGIKILQAGMVSIENCVVTQFGQQGIADVRTNAGGQLFIKDTTTSLNTGSGISVAGATIDNAVLNNVVSVGNAFGVAAGAGSNVVVKRSVLDGNTTAGMTADVGGQITVDETSISGNAAGILSNGSNIRVSNSDINFNTGAAFSGSPVTYGNNRAFGNGSVGTVSAAGGAVSNLGEQ
jgi:Right handed beta helix region